MVYRPPAVTEDSDKTVENFLDEIVENVAKVRAILSVDRKGKPAHQPLLYWKRDAEQTRRRDMQGITDASREAELPPEDEPEPAEATEAQAGGE